jgi:hypothetical protein
MRAALNDAGLSAVKLGAPESVSYEGAWIFKYGAQPPSSYFSKIDIHIQHSYTDISYDDNSAANAEAPLTEFLRVKKLIGKESWQTEYSVAGDVHKNMTIMQRLMVAMRVFSSDMVHAGYSVWMWWCGWFPGWSIDNPSQQVLVDGNGTTTVRKSQMFEAFATIFNNVPKGSHVRKVVTSDRSLKTNFRIMNDLAAFQTPTGTFILLVNGSDTQKSYGVSGLTGTAGTLRSMSGNDAKTDKTSEFTVTDGTAIVTIPKSSVNFIYTK